MEYQIDTRSFRKQNLRVGQGNQEVAVFRKAHFLIYNLKGQVEGRDYQLKLAAPWNGFRYQLRQGDQELATAKRTARMHAYDPDRPLSRHRLVEFQIDLGSQTYNLTPGDRHGLNYILEEAGRECGRLALRSFEEQRDGEWQADFSSPEGWSVPLAAFVAWLAREGRPGDL